MRTRARSSPRMRLRAAFRSHELDMRQGAPPLAPRCSACGAEAKHRGCCSKALPMFRLPACVARMGRPCGMAPRQALSTHHWQGALWCACVVAAIPVAADPAINATCPVRHRTNCMRSADNTASPLFCDLQTRSGRIADPSLQCNACCSAVWQAHLQAASLARWRRAAAASRVCRERARSASQMLQTLRLARAAAAWHCWARARRARRKRARSASHALQALRLARAAAEWRGWASARRFRRRARLLRGLLRWARYAAGRASRRRRAAHAARALRCSRSARCFGAWRTDTQVHSPTAWQSVK